ncbi:MAG TPA: molybdopterin-dependent oxidoreductase, partial [Solirubrobacteraceae bacterium]|nr:molybdopterin-dependent oxidoreductase [Solirubrobacteraceae bacterium]
RLRKGVRRHGLKLMVASPHPSLLDANASLSVRFAPGGGAAFAAALSAALADGATSPDASVEALARVAGTEPDAVRELASQLRDAGEEIVVLWGERLTAGPNGAASARALLRAAQALGLAAVEGAGLLEIPAFANGRGLREAGVLPGIGPGLAESSTGGGASNGASPAPRNAHAIAAGLADGELSALYLLHCEPLRDLPDRELWERALARASTVIAHASFLTDALREHASVVFPAEAYAEKEGTIVHPDGRLQRLRPAIARAGAVRAEWQVLAELALRLGCDTDVLTGAMASRRLFEAVPFYGGLTLDEIGGRGVRWQEREAAASYPAASLLDTGELAVGEPPATSSPEGDAADLAGYRSIWDAPEVELSPALEFLFPRERALLPLTYVGGERT